MILSFQITNAGTIDQTPIVDTLTPGGTYIITSGSTSTFTYTPTELSPEVAAWDTDNSGTISKAEAVAAVADYFKPGGGISKATALAVVQAYFS